VFECVINISEGRDHAVLEALDRAAGSSLRNRHSDPWHHRSVFTLIDEPAALVASVHRLLGAALTLLDIRTHEGVHPRLGVVDVVPFVPLDDHTIEEAVALRDALGDWVAATNHVPVFFYGPFGDGERTLPAVRREAFSHLAPDRGPQMPHPSAGAVTIGARPLLVAWNLWLASTTLARTKAVASELRQPGVRTLGLAVGDFTQVSCNIIDVTTVSLADLFDQVAGALEGDEVLLRGELVGLAPRRVLDAVTTDRWAELGLSLETTIEACRPR
jgi:hypothetical protein